MACEQHVCVQNTQDTQLLPNVVETEQQSLTVVKKLLAIGISSITYLRGLFPEKAYGTKVVEDQKVMILREERSCPGASQIVQWMQGCFDALQKKYLRNLVLSIYTDPEHPNKITECYQFKVQYTGSGPQMEFESKNNNKVAKLPCSNTKKASILLVRKLYTLMQNLGPLPDSVCLSMTLAYYDDVTPQDYQPPGFKEGGSDSLRFVKEPVRLTMGEVVTPFHTLKVDVTTEKDRLEQVGEEEEEEEEEAAEPVCLRDSWMLSMEEEEEGTITKTKITSQQSHTETHLGNSDGNSYLDDAEIQVSCQKTVEVCEEITGNSQGDTVVEKTSGLQVATTRTRSGRVVKATTESKDDTKRERIRKKKPSPCQNKENQMSQFQFPSSQDVRSPLPKQRKFSEPKDRF